MLTVRRQSNRLTCNMFAPIPRNFGARHPLDLLSGSRSPFSFFSINYSDFYSKVLSGRNSSFSQVRLTVDLGALPGTARAFALCVPLRSVFADGPDLSRAGIHRLAFGILMPSRFQTTHSSAEFRMAWQEANFKQLLVWIKG